MEQMDGPVAGSLMNAGHDFKSGTGNVEEGWYGLWSLRKSYLDLGRVKMDSKSTPKPTSSLWKMLSSTSGTGRNPQCSKRP